MSDIGENDWTSVLFLGPEVVPPPGQALFTLPVKLLGASWLSQVQNWDNQPPRLRGPLDWSLGSPSGTDTYLL